MQFVGDAITPISETSYIISQQDETSYWIIDDEIILENIEMIVRDFIIIESTGRLFVRNSRLTFERILEARVGIRIEDGGQLEVRNSQFDSIDYSFWNITALPGSLIDFYNCSLADSHIGTESPLVTINNSSCSIRHTSLQSSSSALIHLLNLNSLDLYDCVLRYATDIGIILEDSSNLTIRDMDIRSVSGPAILVEDSQDITLRNVTAVDTLGIHIQRSEYVELEYSDIHISSENGVSIIRSDFVNLYSLNISQTGQAVVDIQRSSAIILNSSQCDTSDVSGFELHSYMATDIIICRNNFSSYDGFAGMQLGGTSHCIIAHNLFNPWMSFNFGPDSGNYSFDFGGYGNYITSL
jgi:hypothetical protein